MNDVLRLARPDLMELRPYESARSLVGGDASLIFLDANESPGGALSRYPEPQPRALVERFTQLYDVPGESLLIGRGSDEAIDLIVRAFCRAGQDAILVCPPTYGVYEISAQIQGAAVVRAPLRREGNTFVLDEPAIARSLAGVKVVFLCSPNNPTGTAFDREALSRACELTAGRALVVVDEAYAEFSERGTMTASLARFPHLVVLRTMSKAWALAGARCGVALGSKEVIHLLHKIRAPYPLSTPAVDAVLAATGASGRAELAARVRDVLAERERVASLLCELGAHVFASATNFLLVSFRDAKAVMATSRRLGIIVRDRSHEIDGGIRVTIGSRTENDAFVRAVREASR
jgi:histidinol-phosphate aminotransferase